MLPSGLVFVFVLRFGWLCCCVLRVVVWDAVVGGFGLFAVVLLVDLVAGVASACFVGVGCGF